MPVARIALAENERGIYWIGTDEGLTRYMPTRSQPKAPVLLVQADTESADSQGPAQLTSGRRAVFKFGAVDLKTRSETRRYRCRITEGTPVIDGSRKADGMVARKERCGLPV